MKLSLFVFEVCDIKISGFCQRKIGSDIKMLRVICVK